jgi:hypothetical protein
MLKILYIFFFVVVSQTTFCADITWSEKMADAILLQQYSAQKITMQKWVYHTGLLVIMHNDKGCEDFIHMKALTKFFGIHLNEDIHLQVIGINFTDEAIPLADQHPILNNVHNIFQKGVCPIYVTESFHAALSMNNTINFAVTKYGKRTFLYPGICGYIMNLLMGKVFLNNIKIMQLQMIG